MHTLYCYLYINKYGAVVECVLCSYWYEHKHMIQFAHYIISPMITQSKKKKNT